MEDERRRRTRVDFDGVTELYVATQPVPIHRLIDISLNGAYLATSEYPELGEPCQLIIRLAGLDNDNTLRLNGKIIARRVKGVAVSFSSMDELSFNHLRNIVLYNSDDPDMIEQEFVQLGFI